MGIDWDRARVKPGVDRALLDRLVEQQAMAAQAMWGWHSHAGSDLDRVRNNLLERLHYSAYDSASDALNELLEIPEWDEENLCSPDVPDLPPCWRVYPITWNAVFPPLWRMRALRSFAPHELEPQVARWKSWVKQVAHGEHDDYLRELHLHATTDWMHYHWMILREHAEASLPKTSKWAIKPSLVEVRDRVLRFPKPLVSDVRIDPPEEKPEVPKDFGEKYENSLQHAKDLIKLTREWDSNVRDSWKVRYYEDGYQLTLEEFRNKARDEWLLEFFQWADRCVEYGFAFYLSY